MIALGCALVPLLGAALVLLVPCRSRIASAFLVGSSLTVLILAGTVTARRVPGVSEIFLAHFFVVDANSILFLLLISVVFFGVTIYMWYRLSAGLIGERSFQSLVARSLLFFASSVLAVLSNHLLAMWLFLELGTFAIAPLIFFGRGSRAVWASWKYLLFSVIGLGFNFIGLLCLARGMERTHLIDSMEGLQGEHVSFFIDHLQRISQGISSLDVGDQDWWKLGLALMVFGLGTKLGLAPMYSWLPDAYDESPPSITVMLSGIQFNCVILALFRQVGLMRSFDQYLIIDELLVMGTVSIAVAALHLIKADNYKRLIAYASINHAGTIALGLALGKNASYGVVLYVVSNALVKSVLFLTSGNIKAHFGTKKISTLRGLIRAMPFSGWAFMLGVFALLGFAPFGSFLGEVIMLSNMVEGGYLFIFFFICIVLTVILVACGRSLFPMIWGESEEEVPRSSEPLWSNASSLMFIVILVSLGIYTPAWLIALLREVADTLGGW